jgi:hypothetical protein
VIEARAPQGSGESSSVGDDRATIDFDRSSRCDHIANRSYQSPSRAAPCGGGEVVNPEALGATCAGRRC